MALKGKRAMVKDFGIRVTNTFFGVQKRTLGSLDRETPFDA
jgi:hypothetical protein